MAKCKSCGAEIVWAKTLSGKAMPLDAEPWKRGLLVLRDGVCFPAEPLYTSHFATCPQASEHRK